MAFPYTLIGPGGQQYIVGQIPLIQQQLTPQMVTQVPIQVAPQQLQQQVQVQQPQPPPQQKLPDYMSEEKLQEKGKSLTLITVHKIWIWIMIDYVTELS